MVRFIWRWGGWGGEWTVEVETVVGERPVLVRWTRRERRRGMEGEEAVRVRGTEEGSGDGDGGGVGGEEDGEEDGEDAA